MRYTMRADKADCWNHNYCTQWGLILIVISLNDLIYGKKIQKNMNHQQMWKMQHTETNIYDHVLISKILENQLKEKASKFMPADQKWKGKISK